MWCDHWHAAQPVVITHIIQDHQPCIVPSHIMEYELAQESAGYRVWNKPCLNPPNYWWKMQCIPVETLHYCDPPTLLFRILLRSLYRIRTLFLPPAGLLLVWPLSPLLAGIFPFCFQTSSVKWRNRRGGDRPSWLSLDSRASYQSCSWSYPERIVGMCPGYNNLSI